MRYTHTLNSARRRKTANRSSLVLTVFLIALIFILGFTQLDAMQFFGGFLSSFLRVSAAYLISLAVAILMLFTVSSSKIIEDVTLPFLDALQSFPSFALFPLLIAWFGRNSIVTIFILVVAMIWPIFFTLLSAKKQIREDLNEAAFSLGAKGWKYYIYVLFPLLFSSMVTGSIVAWGEAWETIIAAEIIIAIPGVGTYLAHAGEKGSGSVLVIGIFLLLTILFLINKTFWLTLLNSSTRYNQES